MTKGNCKHGEFELTEGCPQCIAERRTAEGGNIVSPVLIVKVRYINQETGETKGREYSYFTEEPLGLGFHVKTPVEQGWVEAVVTALDVPEAEVAAFRNRVRTIPANSIITRPAHVEIQADDPADKDAADFLNEQLAEATPEIMDAAIKEAVAETFEVAAIPPALVTIQNQVGRPAPELLPLYLEAASLLQFAKDRVIATNEDLKPATNDLAIILTCKKAMTAWKDEIVKPLKAKLDLVNQAFGDLMFPVLEADRLTREKVTTFDREQRARSAEAKRIEDEKARLATDEAKFTGTGEFDVPLGTIEEVAPPPERTRTDLGTLGGRDNWKARVVDMKALPDEYKLPDMQTLNAKARSSKGTAEIPGVEFYNDRTTTIRTKS